MNMCPLCLRSLARFAVLAALFLCVTGCETPKEETDVVDKPLVFPVPRSVKSGTGEGKWVSLPRQGGMEYIQALGDMEDVISFYGFAHAVAPAVKTFDDMETVMRADTTFGFRSLQRGDVLGVPVLWFEKEATEKGAGSEALAKTLNAHPRQADGTYIVRTRGVFILKQGAQPQFVTIACARTSAYGQIGPVYERQFQEWLNSIVGKCFL